MKRFVEKFMFWFVWKLPHSLIYYCALRAAANATCGEFGNKTPDEVSIMDMLNAWDKKCGGDKSFRARTGKGAAGRGDGDLVRLPVGKGEFLGRAAGLVGAHGPGERSEMTKSVEKVKCLECGFYFYGYVPKGGDGSVLFVRTHKTMNYSGIRFSRMKCPGSNKQGEIIHE